MMIALFNRLRSEESGSMVLETAIVAPVLAILALGTFEVGSMVSRQHELQSAANEGEIIALATVDGATTNIETVEDIIKTSVALNDDQITIERFWRCNASTTTVASREECAEEDVVSSYIRIEITDIYDPVWTGFGLGSAFTYNVQRTVQLS